jgi:hypothetical protein
MPLPWFISSGLLLVIALMLGGVALHRSRLPRLRRCRNCRYSLEGLTTQTCPEYGNTARSELALLLRPAWKRFVLLAGSCTFMSVGPAAAPPGRSALPAVPTGLLATIVHQGPSFNADLSVACAVELRERLSVRGISVDAYLDLIAWLDTADPGACGSYIESLVVSGDGRIRTASAYDSLSVYHKLGQDLLPPAWVALSDRTRRFLPALQTRLSTSPDDAFSIFSRIAVLAATVPEAAEILINQLDGPHRQFAKTAILTHLGPKSAAAVGRLLRSPSGATRSAACEVLLAFGTEAAPATDDLLAVISMPGDCFSLTVKQTLLAIHPSTDALVPHLAAILASRDNGCASTSGSPPQQTSDRSTSTALVALLGSRIAQSLIPLLTHPEKAVRLAAIDALCDCAASDPATIPALETVVRDTPPSSPESFNARKALLKLR